VYTFFFGAFDDTKDLEDFSFSLRFSFFGNFCDELSPFVSPCTLFLVGFGGEVESVLETCGYLLEKKLSIQIISP
jgi:hypothetical protein